MRRNGIALLDDRETKLALHQKLLRANLPLNLIDRLCVIEQDQLGKLRRTRIMKQLDALFEEITGCEEDEQIGQVKTDVYPLNPVA